MAASATMVILGIFASPVGIISNTLVHGAHPEYGNEWWYFTGNIQTGAGRKFGFQFTLFRYAIAPGKPASGSAWSTNQIYLAHIALSDIGNNKFYSEERFGRGAVGLAGVKAVPFQAWLDEWRVTGTPCASGDCFSVDISAATGDFKLALHLKNSRTMVLHGDRGYSRKSPEPGNASYYYSYTRMDVSGSVNVKNENYDVRGTGWFDHEWSTSALMPDQAGWDWFSIQLSNQTELMVFRLRHRSDAAKHYYYGLLVHADGSLERLSREDFELHVHDTWNSPVTGVAYPSTWSLDLPGKQTHLQLNPGMLNQEMNHRFRYWEGAITATGTVSRLPVSGTGYMELTGY